jgi:hypothetical protein
MNALTVGLFVLSYLLAVADGALQRQAPDGIWPGKAPRWGLVGYSRQHPLLILATLVGIAATVIGLA